MPTSRTDITTKPPRQAHRVWCRYPSLPCCHLPSYRQLIMDAESFKLEPLSLTQAPYQHPLPTIFPTPSAHFPPSRCRPRTETRPGPVTQISSSRHRTPAQHRPTETNLMLELRRARRGAQRERWVTAAERLALAFPFSSPL